MIEGEDIFEVAQETGYRLCKVHSNQTDVPQSNSGNKKPIKEMVFSASWDLNFPHRLYICLQNGQLRVFDMNTYHSDRFQLIFRAHAPVFTNDKDAERLITAHWDKMTSIPDRPNELFFLMGINKNIMYTSLPADDSDPYSTKGPALSTMTRGDMPGYIFGSPVMEIPAHPARVTALVVSPSGHILASGDERGHMRLMQLRLLDEMSIFRNNARKSKKHIAGASAGAAEQVVPTLLPSFNVGIQAHENAPLFAAQWLPLLCDGNAPTATPDSTTTTVSMGSRGAGRGVGHVGMIAGGGVSGSRVYVLATGSMDRSVRLWRVRCSSHSGIACSPLMVLDTLSTHILSLAVFLHEDREAAAAIRRTELLLAQEQQQSPSMVSPSQLAAMRAQGYASFTGRSQQQAASEERMQEKILGARSIFLAAGTNAGTIYVWKLPYTMVRDRACAAPATGPAAAAIATVGGEGIPAEEQFLRDDGRCLHSLLQTSDRPIIHVALSNMPLSSLLPDTLTSPSNASHTAGASGVPGAGGGEGGSGGDVVMAASDTQGIVRVYTPEKELPPEWEVGMREALRAAGATSPPGPSAPQAYSTGTAQPQSIPPFSPTTQAAATPTSSSSANLDELQRHPLHREYSRRRLLLEVDPEASAQRPLVRVGELGFPSPVVACCFPPAYPVASTPAADRASAAAASARRSSLAATNMGSFRGRSVDEGGDDAGASSGASEAVGAARSSISRELLRWDPLKMAQASGPLLVGLASGDARLYDAAGLPELAHSMYRSFRSVYSNFRGVHGGPNGVLLFAEKAAVGDCGGGRADDDYREGDSDRSSSPAVAHAGRQLRRAAVGKEGDSSSESQSLTTNLLDVREIKSVNDSFLTAFIPGDKHSRQHQQQQQSELDDVAKGQKLDQGQGQGQEAESLTRMASALNKKKSVSYAPEVAHIATSGTAATTTTTTTTTAEAAGMRESAHNSSVHIANVSSISMSTAGHAHTSRQHQYQYQQQQPVAPAHPQLPATAPPSRDELAIGGSWRDREQEEDTPLPRSMPPPAPTPTHPSSHTRRQQQQQQQQQQKHQKELHRQSQENAALPLPLPHKRPQSQQHEQQEKMQERSSQQIAGSGVSPRRSTPGRVGGRANAGQNAAEHTEDSRPSTSGIYISNGVGDGPTEEDGGLAVEFNNHYSRPFLSHTVVRACAVIEFILVSPSHQDS